MIPIEFLRQFRFSGYAIFDFAAAFLGIYLLSLLLSKMFLKIRLDMPKKNWLFLTLPVAVFVHLLVGKITPMTRDFVDLNNHYILKLIVLSLLILGVRDIKIVKKSSAKKENQ